MTEWNDMKVRLYECVLAHVAIINVCLNLLVCETVLGYFLCEHAYE